jgi:putative tryptophan/tyrosine transport system substrate-binding protein
MTMWCRTVGCIVTLTLSLLAAPLAADAQHTGKVARIGYLSGVSSAGTPPPFVALRQGLRELGWIEGQNLMIEERWAEGRVERLPALAAELVHLNVHVIVATGPAVPAAKQATSTIPIVMGASLDAVESGLVDSLARPGGNVTGLTLISTDLMGKRLELLKETLPHLSRLAFLTGPLGPLDQYGQYRPGRGEPALVVQGAKEAAQALGMRLHILEAGTPDDLQSAFTAMAEQRAEALYVMEHSFLGVHRTQIADLATKSRLPTFFALRGGVDAGGLMSYAANVIEMHRRAAVYVDKLLKGAKPADLPVEQPTKFELVINLKTAEVLGITIPPTLLFRADEVIR